MSVSVAMRRCRQGEYWHRKRLGSERKMMFMLLMIIMIEIHMTVVRRIGSDLPVPCGESRRGGFENSRHALSGETDRNGERAHGVA